jgi:transcriptional regulator with XRE-family HTH domain
MAIFNERLKALREKAGMTQEGLARTACISVSAVSKLEQSDIDPSWSTVQALAQALGVDCRSFMQNVAKSSPKKRR